MASTINNIPPRTSFTFVWLKYIYMSGEQNAVKKALKGTGTELLIFLLAPNICLHS
jgi:hypothetical protein